MRWKNLGNTWNYDDGEDRSSKLSNLDGEIPMGSEKEIEMST